MPAFGHRDLEKETFWRETIGSWKKSGEGKAAFCRHQGLKLNLFCNWEKRIKERDLENRRAKRRAHYQNKKASRSAQPQSLFVPVVEVEDKNEACLSSAGEGERETEIEIVAPGSGVIVRVGQRFNRDALVRVLDALKEVSC